jgi:steroid 5-alpha reductase family enzyme
MSSKKNWWAGLLLIKLAYVCALIAAYFSYVYLFANQGVLWGSFWADVVATAVIFGFSVVFRNASFYDAYWSVAPVPIVLAWWLLGGKNWTDTPQLLAFIGVMVWSIRLTINWVRGWDGLSHEDWRYGALRAQTGIFYPAVNFLGIHLFPTVLVFLGCLPLYPLFFVSLDSVAGASSNFWTLLGCVVCMLGALIELVADEQQRAFKKQNLEPQAFIQTGLWAYSRHPNYFGEILFWVGVFLCGFDFAFLPEYWWIWSGWIAMLCLFWFISIPMMEKRMLAKRPLYAHYKQSTSRLFFWLPAKKA